MKKKKLDLAEDRHLETIYTSRQTNFFCFFIDMAKNLHDIAHCFEVDAPPDLLSFQVMLFPFLS